MLQELISSHKVFLVKLIKFSSNTYPKDVVPFSSLRVIDATYLTVYNIREDL